MSYLPRDLGNAAEILPRLTAAGCSYVADYDFTTKNSLTLVSGSDHDLGFPAASGLVNRITAVSNRLGTAHAPDLTKLFNGNSTYGFKWRAHGTGSLGGAYCDYNERGLMSASGAGLAMSSGQLYTFVDVVTIDRWRQFPRFSGNQDYLAISAAGSQFLALAGTPGSSNFGRLAAWTSGAQFSNQFLPAGFGTQNGYDGQLLIIIRVMGTGGTAHYVNGQLSSVTGGTPSSPSESVSPIIIGNAPSWMNNDYRSGVLHHNHLIIAGAINANDVAALTSFFNARMQNALAQAARTMFVPIVHSGQSNGDNRNNGANSSSYPGPMTFPNGEVHSGFTNLLEGNCPPMEAENFLQQVTGVPTIWNTGPWATYATPASPGKCLLESNEPSANSTTLGNPAAFINDVSSPSIPGNPATYGLATGAGSAGQQLAAWKTASVTTQGQNPPWAMGWVQGENEIYGWSLNSGNGNWSISGSAYAAQTLEQQGGKYVEGLGILQSKAAALFGVATLPLFIQPVVTISGGTVAGWSMMWIANQIFCDQNPSKAGLMNACPWQQCGLPQLHYVSFMYEALEIEAARYLAGRMQSAGVLPQGPGTGPKYTGFPRLQSVAAHGGNAFFDVAISNPSGAASLVIDATFPLAGWRASAATTTTAVYTAGAVSNGLSGSAGTYEKGGTALTIAGTPTLVTPFTIRIPLASALTSGQKLAVFYADPTAMMAQFNGPSDSPRGHMLTDNAAGTCPPESVEPRYRQNMPVQIEACGLVTIVT